jgi:hypothetical protein
MTPWDAYSRYVIKGNNERFARASAVLNTILYLRSTRNLRRGGPGIPAHDLIHAIVPSKFKHETSAYRVISKLEYYKVIDCTEEWAGGKRRTYYNIGDPFGAQTYLPHSPDLSQIQDNRPVSMDALSRLFIQAHAARQVLERYGLTGEWVAECEALVAKPADSERQNDQFGEETYADDGILKEMLSHANPARI